MFECPAGTHGNTTGLSTVNCAGFCNPGKSCPVGSTNPNGASDCDAGYYCSPVRGTKCGEPLPCGAVEQYCPVGSGAPVPSTPGYYTTPDDANKESTRESQAQCDAGCVKYKCIQGGGWGGVKCARARVSVNVNVNGLCSAMCSDHRSTYFTVWSQSNTAHIPSSSLLPLLSPSSPPSPRSPLTSLPPPALPIYSFSATTARRGGNVLVARRLTFPRRVRTPAPPSPTDTTPRGVRWGSAPRRIARRRRSARSAITVWGG